MKEGKEGTRQEGEESKGRMINIMQSSKWQTETGSSLRLVHISM